MKKTTLLILSLFLAGAISFGQFDNGKRLKIQAGFVTGIPIGPMESPEIDGVGTLTNYYNNFPFYSGYNFEIYPNFMDWMVVGGLYFNNRSYEKWDSSNESNMYLGSSGSMKNYGISFLLNIPELGKKEAANFSVVPMLKIGISEFNNIVRGPQYFGTIQDYRDVYYDKHKTLHLSLSTNFETAFSPKLSFFGQPGIDLYPMPGEFFSQKMLALFSLNAGFNLYLFRNKNIY